MPYSHERDKLHALANFFRVQGEHQQSPLCRFCATGLDELAAECAKYHEHSVVAAPFLEEIRMTALLVSEAIGHVAHDAQAVAFGTLESLAAIMREVSLRRQGELTEAQQTILEFFEMSGLWEQHDGTLVTDYYYNRIPAAMQKK